MIAELSTVVPRTTHEKTVNALRWVLLLNCCSLLYGVFFSPQFTPTSFQARTRETHACHVEDLGDPVLASALATAYGLNQDSILNSLQFFHVTEGLPPDIMHDILEHQY